MTENKKVCSDKSPEAQIRELKIRCWYYKCFIKAIVIILVTVSVVYGIYKVNYDFHYDGRSYMGFIENGTYYYQAEKNTYEWTEKYGRQKLGKKETEKISFSKHAGHGGSEVDLAKGRLEVRKTDQHDSYGDEIDNLYYISDKGEKILASYDHGYNFIDTDNEYLILQTSLYQGRQGKTYCYRIIYDESGYVDYIELIDVFYDLKGKW